MPARFQGMTVTWGTSALAICALAVVGVAFSTYPAKRAASLAPAEALRYEL
jgi:ABC-type lipoprotein release transport system permease subunit